MSTLRLKPCTDPTAPPAQPRVRCRPPAAVRFRDFPPSGAMAARRVHFAPQQPAEPRRQPFSPGMPPGVFARPAAVLVQYFTGSLFVTTYASATLRT